MARKPKLVSWQIYYFASKGKYLGTVTAPDDDVQAAIKKGIEFFNIPPEKQGKITAVVERSRTG